MSGSLWNVVLAASKVGLQFLSTIILAHLLTPDDYGLMGMMAIFIAISETLMDAGLGGALIKKKNATQIDYGTLFSFNLSMAIILYLAIFFAASYVSEFYMRPLLTDLMRLYGIVIIIEAFSLVPKIHLIKRLQFKTHAMISLFSGVIGLVIAIIFAILGYGVYSLIWQLIITSIVYTISLIAVSHYRFAFCFSYMSFKELLGFGFNTTSANFIKNFVENVFVNVIAKVAPLRLTGYYNQSFRLQNVVSSVQTTIIDNALFPVLSREADKRIVDVSVRINYMAAFGAVLLYILFIFNAHMIVLLMLGEDWIGMIPYFKLLLVGGIFQSFTAFNRNIFKTLAETFSIVKCELFSLIALLALLITMKYGINAIIYTFIGYALWRWQVSVVLLARNGHIDYGSYMKKLLQILLPILFSFFIIYSITIFDSIIINGLLQSAFFVVIVIVYGEIFNNHEYFELKALLLKIFNRWKE